MVPTHCPPHTSLPPAPRGRYWPSTEIPPWSLILPWVHLCLPLGFLPAAFHLQCDKSSERLGLLFTSTHPGACGHLLPLPGIGWDPSSWVPRLDRRGGISKKPPPWAAQRAFPPTFRTLIALQSCLLGPVYKPHKSLLPQSLWAHGHTYTHVHSNRHIIFPTSLKPTSKQDQICQYLRPQRSTEQGRDLLDLTQPASGRWLLSFSLSRECVQH